MAASQVKCPKMVIVDVYQKNLISEEKGLTKMNDIE